MRLLLLSLLWLLWLLSGSALYAATGSTQKIGFTVDTRDALTVTSPTATSITATGATLGGDVTADGGAAITERGVVYAATATNADPLIGGTGVTKVTAAGTTGVFTASVTGLTQGTGYSYRAYAINSQGTTYTSVATFTTLSTNADLSALTLSSGALNPVFASATIAYTASVSNATTSITVTPTRAQANAAIEARVNTGTYAAVTSGSPSAALPLNVGTNTVDVRVTAQAGNTKIYSITVNREKASQAITFAPIPDKLTTDSVNLTATGGGSGNLVTFAVTSGPGVITNNVLTFTTSGSVTITASQVGNDNYLAAPDVSRTFNVTKATATVTLGSLAQTYNGTPRTATATTDPANLAVEFTYNESSTPPTNAGSYAVVATINDLIYQGSATGTLEIGKASQIITFAAIPDKLTTDSVDLTATGGASGNPVTFAVTSGPGVITNNVLTFTTSGSVTITASQAGNENYLAAEDVSRTFTVTKATSTIQFADLLQVDDGSERLVSFTTDPEALPYDLLYAGSETAPSLPGSYAVTASLEHPIHSGSGSATLTILGLSGRDQRLPSGSSQPHEGNGTDFGRVILGRVATQTFTITNPGTAPVALTGSPLVEILGDHAGDFQVSVPPAAAIPAGGSVGFEVRFAPTQPGSRQAVVSLPCEALANGPITFAVGGLGAFPTMLAQTITFNLPASLFQSQGPVPLTATASSGLPVTLTVLSGPATLDAGELILNGLGTVKIEARQEGGGNFAAAKPVVRTLTVKADPTGLTLADLTQTYNGTPRPITVLGTEEEVTVTYFINKLPSDSPPTDAGSYPVTAVAGPVTKKGTLVIARAPLIVQVQDQRKLVGQPNPNLTAQVTGFIGEDNQNNVLFRPISVTTKAKADSPPGLYPITSSGGAALNYTLIHRPGTMVVEGYVGNFEALLRDPDTGLPVGLLKLTVPSTSRSASASLALADQAKPLALAGVLNLDPATRIATAQLSRAVNATTTYRLDLALSLFGELAVEVRKNNQLVAEAEDGTRLRDAVKGETVPQMGAYTAVLEPGEDDNAPSAPGWATAKVDAAGRLALTGKLGDGTPFTASLPMDVSEGYRFFVQPYKRAGAHLGGAWSLTAHPELADTWQARGVELSWLKGDNAKDPGYRGGFGPVAVTLEMDAWQPASKTLTLAQLLGTTELSVSHDSTGSDSEVLLASRVAVDPTGVLRVLAPVTNPPNLRKWTAKVNPAMGAYTGSFELFDLTQKRKVNFSGVLRQAADAEADGAQGRGHYLLPPLKGAPSTQTRTGRIEIRRVVE